MAGRLGRPLAIVLFGDLVVSDAGPGRKARMEFHEFNHQYAIACDRVRTGETTDVEAEQHRLQAMVTSLPTDHDQQVARSLIATLPQDTAPPPPPSPEMTEALQIQDSAFFAGGTKEECLAVLADARKKIWEIADRAGGDSARIRGLTRMLEHKENSLTEDLPWEDPRPDDLPDR